MYRQNQSLVSLLEPQIAALDYELWGIELLPDGKGSLLRVYIDNLDGITLEDCERVSNRIIGILDVEDPIRGSYRLEVSSPGLDRPLFSLDQFSRFRGASAAVHLRQKIRERRRLRGEIENVNGDSVTIKCDDESFVITENMIERANILPFADQSKGSRRD